MSPVLVIPVEKTGYIGVTFGVICQVVAALVAAVVPSTKKKSQKNKKGKKRSTLALYVVKEQILKTMSPEPLQNRNFCCCKDVQWSFFV